MVIVVADAVPAAVLVRDIRPAVLSVRASGRATDAIAGWLKGGSR